MSTVIRDVDEAGFADEVLARSYEVPVVVDFWAAWCGPCRTLGPILEDAVTRRGGDVELAKVDVDSNQGLAMQYQVQGIPAVKVFRDGKVVQQFTGAQPAPVVEQVLDAVVPTEADRAARAGDEAAAAGDADAATTRYREALALDPRHPRASLGLAEVLVDTDPDEARTLAVPHRPDPRAEALLTRLDAQDAGGDPDELAARLEADPGDVDARVTLARLLIARDEHERAVEVLLDGVRLGGDAREPSREQLVALFGLLGDTHPLVAATRPRLASALY